MKKAIVLSALCAVQATREFPETWEELKKSYDSVADLFGKFKGHFGKFYDSDEAEKRHLEIFTERVKNILDFNTAGGHSYRKGITRFTDMDADMRRKYVMEDKKVLKTANKAKSSEGAAEPKSKKLLHAGDSTSCDLSPFATSIKDQSSCGSCWAFGTMAAAEASHFLWAETTAAGDFPYDGNQMYKDAWQLSEQSLVECCFDYDCNGCGGGGTYEPMQCAVDMKFLPSKVSYPYTAVDTATCSYSPSQASAVVQAWYEPCASGDESCLIQYIGNTTCTDFYTTALKTSIEVIDSFYDYVSGVYSDPACPDDIHNHAVAIVGWGTSESGDYWLLRNSWGTDWGMDGYFKMARGVNMCCVACENLFFQ